MKQQKQKPSLEQRAAYIGRQITREMTLFGKILKRTKQEAEKVQREMLKKMKLSKKEMN